MRKRISLLAALLVCFSTPFFQSCVKDKCTQQYTFWEPFYKTKTEVRNNIKSNAPRDVRQPGKIYIRGHYIFLNDVDRGIHIIDNTNPQSPQKLAFIDIPGNMDMAVKGNMLYADMYTDIVTIDIADPTNVVVKKINENVLPERFYGSYTNLADKVIIDWIRKDTTVEGYCGGRTGFFGGDGRWKSNDGLFQSASLSDGGFSGLIGQAGSAASPYGVGGSMARFTIVNDHLYAVSPAALKVLGIHTPSDPVFSNTVHLGWNIETIYPFNNKLFIGSNNGMFIYDLTNPANPVRQGQFNHARSCDPVIADNNYAFVTLRSGNACLGFTNQLDVVDISNLSSPSLAKTYQLTNPHGLAKDGDKLIICDGKDGLKFFDATLPASNIILKKTVSGPETFDVIAGNGWALMVAKDGLYQYSYDNAFNVIQLSKIPVKQ
jgi:hypothetical protein